MTLTCGAPPTINVAPTNTTGTIGLNWSSSDIGGVTYIVEKSLNSGAYTQVYSGTGNSTNVTVTSNGSYTFRVKATKAGYAESAWTISNPCIVTLTCGAPPTINVAPTNTTGTIGLNWSSSDIGGVTYIVEKSLNSGAYTQVYSGTSNGTNVTVTSNGSYTFRVKATKAGYAESAWTTSTPCIVTLTCGAPSVIKVPQSNTTGTIYVDWSTSDIGGVTYILEMSKDGTPTPRYTAGPVTAPMSPSPATAATPSGSRRSRLAMATVPGPQAPLAS